MTPLPVLDALRWHGLGILGVGLDGDVIRVGPELLEVPSRFKKSVSVALQVAEDDRGPGVIGHGADDHAGSWGA